MTTLLDKLRFSPRGYLSYMRGKGVSSADTEDVSRLKRAYEQGPPRDVKRAEKTLLVLAWLPSPYCLKIEGLLALGLQTRGYRVVVAASWGSARSARAYHGGLHGFPVVLVEDHLTFEHASEIDAAIDRLFAEFGGDIARVKAFSYRSVLVGLHSLASLASSMPDGRLELHAQHQAMLRRILRRSMLLVDASYRLLEAQQPDLVVGVEKGFVGTAEMFYCALAGKVDYVQWVGCHEPNSIMLKRYGWENCRDHPFSIAQRNWDVLRERPWREAYRDDVARQFRAGYESGNWFRYKNLTSEQRLAEGDEVRQMLGLDHAKKTVVIYSHILNDATLFYGRDLFGGGYEEWLVETVHAAEKNPRVNWVLKLHPANVYRNRQSGYSGKYGEVLALEHAFGELPAFLRLVYPEEKISPLSFFRITDVGITVRGTVGIELPCLGIPVLTAGTGRYANKGFTIDSATREEYLDRLRAIQEIGPLTEAQVKLGVTYAHCVFYSRPARYGDVMEDIYNDSPKNPRYRDVALRRATIAEVIEAPQVQRMLDFLCSSDQEDFLDMTASPADEAGLPRFAVT